MKPIVVAGIVIVQLALVAYSIGILTEQARHRVTGRVMRFLVTGLVLDAVSTVCMILGSSQGMITTHGLLGYSCMLAMAVDTALCWRHRQRHGEAELPRWLHLYSRYAYVWWVAGSYVTGAFLAMMRIKSRD